MEKTLQYFVDQIKPIRGDIGLIDSVKIPYQGQKVPLSQIASSIRKNKQICISPYDVNLLNSIVNELNKMGFNAYVFSKTSLIVSCPTGVRDRILNQIKKLAEDARISIRNARKKARQQDKDIDKPLQKLTDLFIEKVDIVMNKKLDLLL